MEKFSDKKPLNKQGNMIQQKGFQGRHLTFLSFTDQLQNRRTSDQMNAKGPLLFYDFVMLKGLQKLNLFLFYNFTSNFTLLKNSRQLVSSSVIGTSPSSLRALN